MKRLDAPLALCALTVAEQAIGGPGSMHDFPAVTVPLDSPLALAGLATAITVIAYRVFRHNKRK